MSDRGLAGRAAAAARLLLAPPDPAVLESLAPLAEAPLRLEAARQDFYDFLCVPQSGCYIPPYAHVLARGEWNGEYWHFPPPRYDGGDTLRAWYEAAGFDPAALEVDPLIAGANRPLDHAGFVLAFLAGLLAQAETEPDGAPVVAVFAAEHLGAWVDLLAELLAVSGSPYISLLGGGLHELVAELRAGFGAVDEPVEGAA
ncbi:MAG: molecular chaperone TorD family protein [Acetobacteraceae bacterium]